MQRNPESSPPEENEFHLVSHEGGQLRFANKAEAVDYMRRNPGAKYAGVEKPESEKRAEDQKVA